MKGFLANAKLNWRTTLMGLVSGFAVLAVTSPQTFGGENTIVVQVSKALLATGVIGIGTAAQDGRHADGD